MGPVGDQFVDEHTLMSVSVPINNPGGGPVTWGVTGPPGMSISPSGVITWTPGELDGGTSHIVDVEATVGASTATTSFTVNVIETNTPPVIDPISDVTIDEGGTAMADANASDSDVPVQGPTFSLASGPGGASVNPSTGEFSWVTDEADGPGAHQVTIRVRDDGSGLLTDETTFTVFVEEVNQAPTLNPISDKEVTAGANLTFAVSATDPDQPANQLTYTLEPGAPGGASIDPFSGQFDWTPSAGEVGDHTVTVRVTDDGDPAMSDTEEFMVTVNAASLVIAYTGDHSGEYTDPSTLSVRITDALNNPIQGLPITFTLGSFVGIDTTDANGDAEVTNILNQPAGMPGVTVSFGGNGTFVGFSQDEPYEILREKVMVTYLGDTSVVTGSSLVDRAAVRLYATAFQEADGYLGNLTGQALQYGGYFPGNVSNTPDVTAGPAPINANGRSMVFNDFPAAVYTFKVSMAANDYWRVVPAVQFGMMIKVGANREVSGAGWVPFGLGNGHANFNFNVSYTLKKARGSSTFSFVGADGASYNVQATELMEGALILGAGSQSWKSAFTGLAKVVRTMGGSQQAFFDVPFTVDAWDGEMARPWAPDAYGILLLDQSGYIWLETPRILNLGGGNIKIR
ncbi:MAG: putative Ig domain-containing protein [Fimbriimonadales bacterium]